MNSIGHLNLIAGNFVDNSKKILQTNPIVGIRGNAGVSPAYQTDPDTVGANRCVRPQEALSLPRASVAQRRGGIEKETFIQEIRQTNPISPKTPMDYIPEPKLRVDPVILSEEVPLIPSKQIRQTKPM